MFECLHCGNPPDTCVCIPWCYRHDQTHPCKRCETDPEPPSRADTMLVPAAIVTLVITAIIYAIGRCL